MFVIIKNVSDNSTLETWKDVSFEITDRLQIRRVP